MRSTVADYLGGSTLRRRLLSGSTWALGGKIAAAVIGLVTNGLLARLLGTTQEFGAYLLAFTIVSVGAVFGSLGLPKTVLRFVAESMTLGQPGRARRAIYTALGLGVLGALGISLVYYFIVGDLVGRYVFHSTALVAVIGLTDRLDGDLGDAGDHGRDLQGIPRHPYGHPVRRPGDGWQERRPDYEGHVARLPRVAVGDERTRGPENRDACLHRLGRRERGPGRLVLAQEDLLPLVRRARKTR